MSTMPVTAPPFHPLAAALFGITHDSQFKETDPKLKIIKLLLARGDNPHLIRAAGFPSSWDLVWRKRNPQLRKLFMDFDREIPMLMGWFNLESRNSHFLANFIAEAGKYKKLELDITSITHITDAFFYAIRHPDSIIYAIIKKIMPGDLLAVFSQAHNPSAPSRPMRNPLIGDLNQVFLYARLHPSSQTAQRVINLIHQQKILPEDALHNFSVQQQRQIDDVAAISVAQTGFLDDKSTLHRLFVASAGGFDNELWNHITGFIERVEPVDIEELVKKGKKSIIKEAKSVSVAQLLASNSRFFAEASCPIPAARNYRPEEKKQNIRQLVQMYEREFYKYFKLFDSSKLPVEELQKYKKGYQQAFYKLQEIAAFYQGNDGGAAKALERIEAAMTKINKPSEPMTESRCVLS